MLIKFETTGKSMIKYSIISIIIKLILVSAFIMSSIPYFTEIIEHIEGFANMGDNLEIYFVLKNIGWVILNFIGAITIELIILGLIIIPIAKSELNR